MLHALSLGLLLTTKAMMILLQIEEGAGRYYFLWHRGEQRNLPLSPYFIRVNRELLRLRIAHGEPRLSQPKRLGAGWLRFQLTQPVQAVRARPFPLPEGPSPFVGSTGPNLPYLQNI